MHQTNDTLPPPMFAVGDSPRTRESDPITSHAAGDRSQATRARIRIAVLEIIKTVGPRSGNEVNRWYTKLDYPPAHFDSPRKRAGELHRDGLLSVDRSNGIEGVYRLTDAGHEFLDEVSR